MPANPDNQALHDGAAWLTRLTAASPSEAELDAFRKWLAADVCHAAAMDLVERAWRVSGGAGDLIERRRAARVGLRASLGRWLRPAMALVAASFLVAVVVGYPVFQTGRNETAIGRVMDVGLSDGTVVTLDADSAIRVDFSPFGRHVSLERGVAEFQVAHEAFRSFTVDSDRAEIRVTGTKFIVRTGNGASSVFLVNGRVELSDARTHELRARLMPGQKATVTADGKVTVGAADTEAEEAWLSGRLIFDRTPLRAALAEFRRFTVTQVTLATDDLGALEVSGVYRAMDFRAFVSALARIYPIRITETGPGQVLIERVLIERAPRQALKNFH